MTPHLRLIRGAAILVLLIGLGLRLGVVLAGDPLREYTAGGGDTAWLLANGEGLVSGQNQGFSRYDIPYYMETLPTPPLYLLLVGSWQRVAGPTAAIVGIRLTQVALSLLTALAVAGMAWGLTRNRWAVLLVLAAMCLDPSQILEARNITTETLYIALVMSALWLYMRVVTSAPQRTLLVVGVGVLLGLATLTRAVGLLFPLVLVLHAAWTWRRQWRTCVRVTVVLLIAYSVVVGSWTLYNLVQYNRFVVASTQMFSAIWRGAVDNDGSPQQNDALLIDPQTVPDDCTADCKFQVPTTTYVQQTTDVIRADPLGYLAGRVRELAGSVLQPYAATYLGGEGLRDLLAAWARDGFTGAGLTRLVSGDHFWLKVMIYLFQFAAYGLGLVGLWSTRQRLAVAGVPLSFILYTLAIHTVLLALPRYLFPIVPCCWALAAGVLRLKDVPTVKT